MWFCDECKCLYYREDLRVLPKEKTKIWMDFTCPIHRNSMVKNFSIKTEYNTVGFRADMEFISSLVTYKAISKKVKVRVVNFKELTPAQLVRIKHIYNL